MTIGSASTLLIVIIVKMAWKTVIAGTFNNKLPLRLPKRLEAYAEHNLPAEYTGPKYRTWKNGIEQVADVMTPTEYAIWEVLEPRLEDIISLDLNDVDDSNMFRELVRQIATAASND